MRTLRPALALVLTGVLALAACGDSAGDAAMIGDTPTVIATTSIWADIVSNLACGGIADVETLLPPAADAHAFEPSLADRERLEAAALVVANGLGLEGGLEETLEAVEAAGTPVVRIADQIEDHGDDPHVWFDPVLVAAALPVLAGLLVSEAGLERQAVETCAAAYQAELTALDAEIVDIVAAVPADRRVLVTNHESLAYFADRYGLVVLGSVIPAPSTLAESSPDQLDALAEAIDAAGAPAIFVEHEHGSAEAEALAERVGVPIHELHTEGLGEPGSAAGTYVGLLRTNAQVIADALD